jgi:acyl-CoA hydrolase
MKREYTTSFTVYPEDANCMTPMIFGGAFFSHMDKAAAAAVRRALYSSKTCETAVTFKFNGTFHKPCYIGDFIILEAKVVSFGHKSIVVTVEAYREWADSKEKVAESEYVFITIKNDEDVVNKPHTLPYANHGLKNDS